MRLLKFVLATLFAVLAMVAGLFVALILVLVGFTVSVARRWFGAAPATPRPPRDAARATQPPVAATSDTIDVVVTEVTADR